MCDFKVTYSLTALIYILFLGSILIAQTVTNEGYLTNFATEKEVEYNKNRAEVEKYARKNNIPVRQELPDGTTIEMHHLENGKPIYYMTHNLGAAQTTRVDELWPTGSLGLSVTGSGYTKLGEWDAGRVRLSHQEFGGRVVMGDTTTVSNYHSTHVAGTMVAAGFVPGAKGMAYQANLTVYKWDNDNAEMAAAAAAGMELSNHSCGYSAGWVWTGTNYRWWGDLAVSTTEDYQFGYYSSYSADWDDIAYNAPYYLIVKSAGNDRNDDWSGTHEHYDGVWVSATDSHGPDGGADGYDCIEQSGISKNILTVGAVNEVLSYSSPSDITMSTFSSWGPADDGRIKPDIVGKGVSVYSTDNGNDSDYTTLSGTSMSSPNVTGTLALLQQHYQNTHSSAPMDPRRLRA